MSSDNQKIYSGHANGVIRKFKFLGTAELDAQMREQLTIDIKRKLSESILQKKIVDKVVEKSTDRVLTKSMRFLAPGLGSFLTKNLFIEDEVDDHDYKVTQLSEIFFPLFPEFFTLFHLSALAGRASIMKVIIDQGVVIYNFDAFRKTPLTYAIEYGNYDTTEMILLFARDFPDRVVFTIRDVKNVLESAHTSALEYIKQTFKPAEVRDCGRRAYIQSDIETLELTGDVLNRIDVKHMYEVPNGMSEDEFEEEKKEVEFLVSRFKYNTVLGSQDSLDFLEAMDECEHDDIWNTSFRYIIDHKWFQARRYIRGLAVAHLLYLLLLTVYATAFLKSDAYSIVIFCLTLLFYSFEVL